MKNQQPRKEQIAESLRRLAATYAETLGVLCRELDLQEITWSEVANSRGSPAGRQARLNRPVADRSTLSVLWQGGSCFLGNTLLFRLFEKLSRQPSRYCSHDELLNEVWGGPRSEASIRNVVKRLRDRLSAAGMEELAHAIGSVRGHYVLLLDRLTWRNPTEIKR